MLQEIKILFDRELKSYFVTPLIYVVFTVVFLIAGLIFYNYLTHYQTSLPEIMQSPKKDILGFDEIVLQPFFMTLSGIFIFILPLLSMKIFAEENRSGTIELLLTSPVRQLSVITGKFLAILFVFSIILLVSSSYFLLLFPYASNIIDFRQLLSVFCGLLFFGGTLLSFGILASSLTSSQLVAALISFGFNFIFWLFNSLSLYFTGTLGNIFSRISLSENLLPFIKGIFDTRSIIFFLSLIIFSLFLTDFNIESRRWRS